MIPSASVHTFILVMFGSWDLQKYQSWDSAFEQIPWKERKVIRLTLKDLSRRERNE